jgi:hypothetical protein
VALKNRLFASSPVGFAVIFIVTARVNFVAKQFVIDDPTFDTHNVAHLTRAMPLKEKVKSKNSLERRRRLHN